MTAPVRMHTTLTAAAMQELIPAMAPGQSMVYHVGSLMRDRKVGPNFATVHGVAQAAYEAYERGEVTLVQHKTGPLTFEYILRRLAPAVGRNAAKVDGKVQRKPAHA